MRWMKGILMLMEVVCTHIHMYAYYALQLLCPCKGLSWKPALPLLCASTAWWQDQPEGARRDCHSPTAQLQPMLSHLLCPIHPA